jgi:HEAT repeat protein
MVALAQRKIAGALPAIIRHLNDKDTIIQNAAVSAVLDFAAEPLPANLLGQLHAELLGTLESGDNQMRVKIAEVLMRLNPRRSPLKERLEQMASKPDLQLPVKAVLGKLIDARPAVKAGAGKSNVSPTATLEKKRAYMMARQEWIRSGKRGPEPVLEEEGVQN